MAAPKATMIRKLRNVARTGGRSAGGMSFRPLTSAPKSWNDRKLSSLGMRTASTALRSLAASGQASYLLDVTPLTLRVGTAGGWAEAILDKNTPIPIEKSKTFTTSRDGQDRVRIRVYQGESKRADECEFLGEFEFSGFRIGYRGEVLIQVTFEIDSNGIVNVSATDTETGQKASTTINLSSGLSESDIRSAIDKNAEVVLAGHPAT